MLLIQTICQDSEIFTFHPILSLFNITFFVLEHHILLKEIEFSTFLINLFINDITLCIT